MKKNSSLKKLIAAAHKARKHSHSPYSHYKVGSAVLMSNQKIYSGTNIENASYGGTICAERIAICKAISEGAKKIKEIVVLTDANPPWPPCGICRQVIAEFATPQTLVHLVNLQGDCQTWKFDEIFPSAFKL